MEKTVADVMTRSPRWCRRTDSLLIAAKVLWENDCGCVPVVDEGLQVVGMITDRDCLMAAFTRGRKLEDLSVQSAMAHIVFSVRAAEPVEAAARRMVEHAVRRLPVLDDHGRLAGIVSLADLCQPKAGLDVAIVAKALSAVTTPRKLVTRTPAKTEGIAAEACAVPTAGPLPHLASVPAPTTKPSPTKAKGKRK